jgi:hypothetical protein
MEKYGDCYDYAVIVARFLNWPETLEDIGGCIDKPQDVARLLEMRVDEFKKVWGNAYVVTTHGLRMGKVDYLCERILPPLYEALGGGQWFMAYKAPPLLADHHKRFMRFEGLASFMAAQVIADLKNTPRHPLYEAFDWHSWSAPGPGSLRGLSWFFNTKVTAHAYQHYMQEVASYVTAKSVIAMAALMDPHHEAKVNMQDLQNCLCEYDKYMRVKNGTGRSKRHYPGER